MSLYSAPSLSGVMIVSQQYKILGTGLTDRVFILGHVDGIALNDPYQVLDVNEAIVALNSDPNSPVVRTLLELYYGGCRDIFCVAVAPMSEYMSDPTLRNNAYYVTYANRLAVTYSMLQEQDLVQIVLPVEAPYYNAYGVDFLTPLANHCATSLDITNVMRIGLLGTRTGLAYTDTDISNMVNDVRLQNIGANGKFVSVVVGEGSYAFKELPTMYSASAVGATAAIISSLPLNMSVANVPLPNIVSPIGRLNDAQIRALAEAKLIPISLTNAGIRGATYQVVALTDSTLGITGTDFWSLMITRLMIYVITQLQALGNRFLGTIALSQFGNDCNTYLKSLVSAGVLRDYSLTFARNTQDLTEVDITVGLKPWTALRQIMFTTTVGPGA